MTVDKHFIARKIKDARKDRSLTQQDLANHLGRTAASISDLERGKVQASASDLLALANLLEKPIEYFYGVDFGGRDVEDLVFLIRNLDLDTRSKLIPTIYSIARMQEISALIQSTDATSHEELSGLAEDFFIILRPFLENVESLYLQGKELNSKLETLFDLPDPD